MTENIHTTGLAPGKCVSSRRCVQRLRAGRIHAWLALAFLGAHCGTGREVTTFSHSLGDLSGANRLEVTTNGVTPVTTVTDPQRVAAVIAFVGRYRDGWINVWTGGAGARYVTFYKAEKALKAFGFNSRGINDGDYARPLSQEEIAELVGILGIEWPPPENPTGTPRRD